MVKRNNALNGVPSERKDKNQKLILLTHQAQAYSLSPLYIDIQHTIKKRKQNKNKITNQFIIIICKTSKTLFSSANFCSSFYCT